MKTKFQTRIALVCVFTFLFLAQISNLTAQKVYLTNIDTSTYPNLKAKVKFIDEKGKLITPDINSFSLMENGEKRKITDLVCKDTSISPKISFLLSIDANNFSKNNEVNYFKLSKTISNYFVNNIDLNKNEIAISTFDQYSYINRLFTKDKSNLESLTSKLESNLDSMTRLKSSSNYDNAFLQAKTGSLNLLKSAVFKKALIFISDGISADQNQKQTIINAALKDSISIFVFIIGNNCPNYLKDISKLSNGMFYENIFDEKTANEAFIQTIDKIYNYQYCDLNWESAVTYQTTNKTIVFEIDWLDTKSKIDFTNSDMAQAKLEINPQIISFHKNEIESILDTAITIFAKNSDFVINEIRNTNSSNSFAFQGLTLPLLIEKNKSKKLKIRYSKQDANYAIADFEIISDKSKEFFTISAGKSSTIPNNTLKVNFPNGGEKFGYNLDTLIKWDGLNKNNNISLDLSIDSGVTWQNITNYANNSKYNWKDVFTKSSNKCLIRAKQFYNNGFDKDSITTLNNGYEYEMDYLECNSKYNQLLCIDANGHAKIRDIESGMIKYEFESYNYYDPIFDSYSTYNSNGDKLYSANYDGIINIRKTSTSEIIQTINTNKKEMTAIAISSDEKILSCAYSDNSVLVWDLILNKEMKTLNGDSQYGSIYDIKIITSSNPKIICRNYSHIDIWDIDKSEIIKSIDEKYAGFKKMLITKDASKIVTTTYANDILVWDFNNGKLLDSIAEAKAWLNPINDICLSRDDSKLFVVRNDSTCYIYDLKTMKIISSIKNNSIMKTICNGKVSNEIISYNEDLTIKTWSINNSKLLKSLQFYYGMASSLALSKDKKQIIFSLYDYTIRTWDLLVGKPLNVFKGPSKYYSNIALSKDGTKMYALGYENNKYFIHCWDFNTQKLLKTIEIVNDSFMGLYIEKQEIYITRNYKNEILIYNLNSGDLIQNIKINPQYIISSICDADVKKLFVSCSDSTIQIYDIATGNLLNKIKTSNKDLYIIGLSKDETKLITNNNTQLQLWDLLKSNLYTRFQYSNGIRVLDYNKNQEKLIAQFGDEINILDVNKLQILSSYKMLYQGLNSIVYNDVFNKIILSEEYRLKMFDVEKPVIQSDISDSTFSIIIPELKCKDIDLQNCLINSTKDTIISNFISNKDEIASRIDTIYFRGTDSASFRILANQFPIPIYSKDSLSMPISFTANHLGLHNAEIVLVNGRDSIVQKIRGNGIESKVLIFNKLIDFGKVNQNIAKDTMQVFTIKNINEEPIKINQIKIEGLNKDDFSLIDTNNLMTIKPNEIKKLNLRVKSNKSALISSKLIFVLDGIDRNTQVQLLADIIGKDSITTNIENQFEFSKNSNLSNVAIQPNPIENNGKLVFESKYFDNFEVKLVNLNGQLISKIFEGHLESGKHIFEINTSQLNNVCYFIVVQSTSEIATIKIEIVK